MSKLNYENAVHKFNKYILQMVTEDNPFPVVLMAIGKDPFNVVENTGDGHCFYHSILRYIYDTKPKRIIKCFDQNKMFVIISSATPEERKNIRSQLRDCKNITNIVSVLNINLHHSISKAMLKQSVDLYEYCITYTNWEPNNQNKKGVANLKELFFNHLIYFSDKTFTNSSGVVNSYVPDIKSFIRDITKVRYLDRDTLCPQIQLAYTQSQLNKNSATETANFTGDTMYNGKQFPEIQMMAYMLKTCIFIYEETYSQFSYFSGKDTTGTTYDFNNDCPGKRVLYLQNTGNHFNTLVPSVEPEDFESIVKSRSVDSTFQDSQESINDTYVETINKYHLKKFILSFDTNLTKMKENDSNDDRKTKTQRLGGRKTVKRKIKR